MDPFDELADEARAGEDVRQRAAARWLLRSAAESATLVGTLVDLSERGDAVALRTRSGRTHRGALSMVGADFVLVADAYVRVAAVVAVRVAGGGSRSGVATGDRPVPRDVPLAAVLSELAADRPVVLVVPESAGGEAVRGELRSAGIDLLTVLLEDGSPCHVPLAAVSEVVVVG